MIEVEYPPNELEYLLHYYKALGYRVHHYRYINTKFGPKYFAIFEKL